MRTLILSWEYPPRIVGGLGRHVHRLATGLAEAGHDVHVVTRDHPDAPPEETIDGVHIVRAPGVPAFHGGDQLGMGPQVGTGALVPGQRLLDTVPQRPGPGRKEAVTDEPR